MHIETNNTAQSSLRVFAFLMEAGEKPEIGGVQRTARQRQRQHLGLRAVQVAFSLALNFYPSRVLTDPWSLHCPQGASGHDLQMSILLISDLIFACF